MVSSPNRVLPYVKSALKIRSESFVLSVEILKGFESNLSRAKGDVTLVAQELLDRVMPPVSRRRK